MDRRYEAYKDRVVTPFFRDHFARLDRQIVLMDVLGALHQGPQAVADLRRTMAEILQAFRVGRNRLAGAPSGRAAGGKILFAATKADHLHHEQHPQLTAISRGAAGRGRSPRRLCRGRGGGDVASPACARRSRRRVERDGQRLPAVRGGFWPRASRR
ncbi:hypothetical protein MASR1M65_04660 [Saprospiraceae bacterium]